MTKADSALRCARDALQNNNLGKVLLFAEEVLRDAADDEAAAIAEAYVIVAAHQLSQGDVVGAIAKLADLIGPEDQPTRASYHLWVGLFAIETIDALSRDIACPPSILGRAGAARSKFASLAPEDWQDLACFIEFYTGVMLSAARPEMADTCASRNLPLSGDATPAAPAWSVRRVAAVAYSRAQLHRSHRGRRGDLAGAAAHLDGLRLAGDGSVEVALLFVDVLLSSRSATLLGASATARAYTVPADAVAALDDVSKSALPSSALVELLARRGILAMRHGGAREAFFRALSATSPPAPARARLDDVLAQRSVTVALAATATGRREEAERWLSAARAFPGRSALTDLHLRAVEAQLDLARCLERPTPPEGPRSAAAEALEELTLRIRQGQWTEDELSLLRAFTYVAVRSDLALAACYQDTVCAERRLWSALHAFERGRRLVWDAAAPLPGVGTSPGTPRPAARPVPEAPWLAPDEGALVFFWENRSLQWGVFLLGPGAERISFHWLPTGDAEKDGMARVREAPSTFLETMGDIVLQPLVEEWFAENQGLSHVRIVPHGLSGGLPHHVIVRRNVPCAVTYSPLLTAAKARSPVPRGTARIYVAPEIEGAPGEAMTALLCGLRSLTDQLTSGGWVITTGTDLSSDLAAMSASLVIVVAHGAATREEPGVDGSTIFWGDRAVLSARDVLALGELRIGAVLLIACWGAPGVAFTTADDGRVLSRQTDFLESPHESLAAALLARGVTEVVTYPRPVPATHAGQFLLKLAAGASAAQDGGLHWRELVADAQVALGMLNPSRNVEHDAWTAQCWTVTASGRLDVPVSLDASIDREA